MSRFPLDSSGLWREVRIGRSAAPAPGLFLDRDGSLIELVDYLSRADEVVPIPGAFESLAQAARCGYRVVIVTNQSGDRPRLLWVGCVRRGPGACDRARPSCRGAN